MPSEFCLGAKQLTGLRFAAAFGYPLPQTPPDYGLDRAAFPDPGLPPGYVLFAHGTTWRNKLWPVAQCWQAAKKQTHC